MRRALLTVIGAVGIVLVWAIPVSVVYAVAEKPFFVPDDPAWLRLWWEFTPLVLALVLALVVARQLGIRLPGSSQPGLAVLGGLALGSAWLAVSIGVLFASDAIEITRATDVDLFWVYWLALGLNTVMQEVLVHGVIWIFVASRHGSIAALVSTTVVFVAMHGGASEAGWVAVASLTTAGLVFGLLTGWFGGLPTAISAHLAWNALGGLLLGAVSLGDSASWFRTKSLLPTLAGTAQTGIEGGVVVLVATALLAAILAAILAVRTRQLS